MRKVDALLNEYGESHQNPINKLIHWLCVPAIVWSVIALLWSIPFPWELSLLGFPVNWAIIVLVLAQLYYFRLSIMLGLGLLLVNAALIWLTHWVMLNVAMPLWQVAVIVFVIAWIVQFIGHAVEGKRPSFFKDMQFLLIGPAWLMGFVFRSLRIPY